MIPISEENGGKMELKFFAYVKGESCDPATLGPLARMATATFFLKKELRVSTLILILNTHNH